MLGCILTLVGAFPVHADVLSSYGVDTIKSDGNSGGYIFLGNGLTGIPSYVQIMASTTDGGNHGTGSVAIAQCPSAISLSGCFVYASMVAAGTITPNKGVVTTFFNAPTTSMQSTAYYYISFSAMSNAKNYGSADGSSLPGVWCKNITDPTACTIPNTDANITKAWFVLGSSDTVPLQAQVYEVLEPDQFEVTASSDVTIEFTYLNTNYDKVGIEVIDQSNNLLVLQTGEQNAVQSGLYSYGNVLSLTANHAYRIRGYLRSTAGTSTTIYGPYRDFSTVSDQFFTATSTLINVSQVTNDNATTSLGTAFEAFGNFPSYISNKVPFGYIWEIRDIFRNAATTSSVYGELAVDFDAMSLATGTKDWLPSRVVFFGTTTVTTYLTGTILGAFNLLSSAALIILWLMYVYKRTLSIITPAT